MTSVFMPGIFDPMKNVPLEVLELESMASGDVSLRLTRCISWTAFPRYAEAVAALLGATMVSSADSPVERVREVSIDGRPFWIAFDDLDLGVSLDPRSPEASALVPDLREKLIVHRDSEVAAARQLAELRLFLGQSEIRAPRVSAWSVGMHIEHCCLAMSAIAEALIASAPPPPRAGFSLLRLAMLTTGYIPRGRGKAPGSMTPAADTDARRLHSMLDEAESLLRAASELSPEAWFRHFVFGVMNRDETLKFLAIHNAHHVKIIRDVLARHTGSKEN